MIKKYHVFYFMLNLDKYYVKSAYFVGFTRYVNVYTRQCRRNVSRDIFIFFNYQNTCVFAIIDKKWFLKKKHAFYN